MADFDSLISSPQFMMGLGLLANRGNFNGGLLGAQFANQQQQLAQQKAQQEARNTFLQGLPPEQQAYAQAYPNQFGQAYGNQMFAAPKDRKVIQGADGFNYYLDTGERVLPGVTKAPSLPTGMRQDQDGSWAYDPAYLQGQQALKKAGATNITNVLGGQKLTPGQEALDKEFAKQIVGFEAGGEYADTEKMIGQLEEAHAALGDEGKNLTGPMIGHTPDSILSVINPDAVSTREAVEEVVQRNLKAVLGAQFTEKEGERLIARAFNPKLDEAENKKRVGRLINQMKKAYAAKKSAAEYFKKTGTMRGWQGTMPNLEDFYQAIEKGGPDTPSVDDLLKKYGG